MHFSLLLLCHFRFRKQWTIQASNLCTQLHRLRSVTFNCIRINLIVYDRNAMPYCSPYCFPNIRNIIPRCSLLQFWPNKRQMAASRSNVFFFFSTLVLVHSVPFQTSHKHNIRIVFDDARRQWWYTKHSVRYQPRSGPSSKRKCCRIRIVNYQLTEMICEWLMANSWITERPMITKHCLR